MKLLHFALIIILGGMLSSSSCLQKKIQFTNRPLSSMLDSNRNWNVQNVLYLSSLSKELNDSTLIKKQYIGLIPNKLELFYASRRPTLSFSGNLCDNYDNWIKKDDIQYLMNYIDSKEKAIPCHCTRAAYFSADSVTIGANALFLINLYKKDGFLSSNKFSPYQARAAQHYRSWRKEIN